MWAAAIFISLAGSWRRAVGGFLGVGFYFLLESEITGKNCALVSVLGGRAQREMMLLGSPWGKDVNRVKPASSRRSTCYITTGAGSSFTDPKQPTGICCFDRLCSARWQVRT